MVEQDDEKKDAALLEEEMTSIMGPEERRMLQQAARRGAEAASPEVVREEDHARPTARPPAGVGEEPAPLALSSPPLPPLDLARALATEPGTEAADLPAPVPRSPVATPARPWPVVAFVLLAAAALYAAVR